MAVMRRMSKFLAVGAAVLAFGLPTVAAARGKAIAPVKQRVPAAVPEAARYQRTTRMKFKDDVVAGRRATGGGSVVNVRPGSKHSSLIVVRQSFLPELIKSADLL